MRYTTLRDQRMVSDKAFSRVVATSHSKALWYFFTAGHCHESLAYILNVVSNAGTRNVTGREIKEREKDAKVVIYKDNDFDRNPDRAFKLEPGDRGGTGNSSGWDSHCQRFSLH